VQEAAPARPCLVFSASVYTSVSFTFDGKPHSVWVKVTVTVRPGEGKVVCRGISDGDGKERSLSALQMVLRRVRHRPELKHLSRDFDIVISFCPAGVCGEGCPGVEAPIVLGTMSAVTGCPLRGKVAASMTFGPWGEVQPVTFASEAELRKFLEAPEAEYYLVAPGMRLDGIPNCQVFEPSSLNNLGRYGLLFWNSDVHSVGDRSQESLQGIKRKAIAGGMQPVGRNRADCLLELQAAEKSMKSNFGTKVRNWRRMCASHAPRSPPTEHVPQVRA
jgi:hypothetical protein